MIHLIAIIDYLMRFVLLVVLVVFVGLIFVPSLRGEDSIAMLLISQGCRFNNYRDALMLFMLMLLLYAVVASKPKKDSIIKPGVAKYLFDGHSPGDSSSAVQLLYLLVRMLFVFSTFIEFSYKLSHCK